MVRSSKQSGFTLVLGLVFVLVTSMSAAVLMRGSVMQEQMTANMNHKAISFMAAEAGADVLRARLVGVWPVSDSKIDNLRGLSENFGVSGRYRVDSIEIDAGGSVIATITGHAVDGEHVLGTTAIQVEFGGSRMGFPGLLTLAGNVTKFHPGNSGHLSIDGGGGLAIATLTEESETEVKSGVLAGDNGNSGGGGNKGGNDSGLVGEYLCENDPCIGYVKPEDVASPWGNANELMRFLEVLRLDKKNVQVIDGSEKFDSSKSVTIVEGKTAWNGKEDYNGIIIFLGDDVVFNGSGHLKINGAIYMANIEQQEDDSYQFGSLKVTMNGGNAKFKYDSSAGSSLLMPTILSWRETIETDQ